MTNPVLISRQIRKVLGGFVDSLGRTKTGTYRVRRGYFYRNGWDAQAFATRVSDALTIAGIQHRIEDSGDHWAAFKGGKGVAANSHFYVEFTVLA